MHLHILAALLLAAVAFSGPATAQERSECETSCGNVTIAFPFGSTERCYHSLNFLVTCNDSVPFFGNRAITNMSISTGELEIMMFVAKDCYNTSGRVERNGPTLTLGRTSREFRISTKNRFVAIGCDTHAYVTTDQGDGSDNDGTGCTSICGRNSSFLNGSCSGAGCCEVAVPEGMSSIEMSLSSYYNHKNITDFNPCSYAFFVQDKNFNFSTTNLQHFGEKEMPMLLEWAIGTDSCDKARMDDENFLCKGHSECDPDYRGPGYRCRCSKGFEGLNPYSENNCTNINECAHQNGGCQHECIDTEGSYSCRCRNGYFGDGVIGGTGCTADQSLVIKIVVGTSSAAILLFLFVFWLYFGHKKRKLMMLKEKFFRQNGGIMLQQRISQDGGSHNQAKVFTTEELKKATDNYDESRIIGKGGYGTVFKGVLCDNTTVAIKKSKLVDQTQIEQFVNEVVILSQINHRNVVRLIGCCLETEVPLLVYEFIPNGTLSDHIHNDSKSLAITWDIRLRIATETAGALSYLHSAASVPIVHRDIKPTNILLDESYVAKVADFGASKLIPMDQIELATIVQGTLGYLDPEYLHTSQLTDKSDVYSFGVLLVELFTGKKALSFDRPEKERNLAKYFLSCLKEGRLFEVLDEHFQLDEVPNAIINVSRVAERCLRVKGDERPTMKEVAIELEGILASVTHKHPWVQSTSNEEESKYLLKEPKDDFEYMNGADTSSGIFDSMSQHTMLAMDSGR